MCAASLWTHTDGDMLYTVLGRVYIVPVYEEGVSGATVYTEI